MVEIKQGHIRGIERGLAAAGCMLDAVVDRIRAIGQGLEAPGKK